MFYRFFQLLWFLQLYATASFCQQTPEIRIPEGHLNAIQPYIGISADRQQAITSDGKSVIVWDIQTGCAVKVFDGFLNDKVFEKYYGNKFNCLKAMFSADERYIFMFMASDLPGDMKTLDLVLQFDRKSNRFIKAIDLKRAKDVMLTSDGRYILASSLFNHFGPVYRVFDIESGAEVKKFELSYKPSDADSIRAIMNVNTGTLIWNENGKKILAGAYMQNIAPGKINDQYVVIQADLGCAFQKDPPMRYSNQVFWQPDRIYATGEIDCLAATTGFNEFAFCKTINNEKAVYVYDGKSRTVTGTLALGGDCKTLKFSTGGDSLYIYTKQPDRIFLWNIKKRIVEDTITIDPEKFILADLDKPEDFWVRIYKKNNEIEFVNSYTGRKSLCKGLVLPAAYSFFSLDGRSILSIHEVVPYGQFITDTMLYYWSQRVQRFNAGLIAPGLLKEEPSMFYNAFQYMWRNMIAGYNQLRKTKLSVWNLYNGNVSNTIPPNFRSEMYTVTPTGTYCLKKESVYQADIVVSLPRDTLMQRIFPASNASIVHTKESLMNTLFGYFLNVSRQESKAADIKFNRPGIKLLFNNNKDSVRLYALDSTDWILLGKDGYFMSSRNAAKSIFYTIGNKVFPFDQFDLQFNRPDKVLGYIGIAHKQIIDFYKRAYDKRLSKMGFDPVNFEKDRSFNVPEITVFSNRNLSPVNKRIYNLSVEATDKLYLLDRLNLYINGVPVYGQRSYSLKTVSTKKIKQKLSVVLSKGNNIIEVSVLNQKGVESLKERIEIQYIDTTHKDDLYLIAIGAGKYSNALKDLNYAAKDAQDVAALFKQNTSLYKNIISFTLTNEKVTVSNILRLQNVLKQSKVDDIVIIFYAGHGCVSDSLDYYLGTYNMNFSDPLKGGLRYSDLEGLLDDIPARNKLLLVDACHSGEIDKAESKAGVVVDDKNEQGVVKFRAVGGGAPQQKHIGLENSFEIMRQLFVDLRRATGANVISSAGALEYSLEGDKWKNGLFTYCFLQGLKEGKADMNRDGKIMFSELLQYIQQRVVSLTDGKQTPTSRAENLLNDSRIW